MKIFILLIAIIILIFCENETIASKIFNLSESRHITTYIDSEHEVICYSKDVHRIGTAISCLPYDPITKKAK